MATADQDLEWQPEAPPAVGMFEALVSDFGDLSLFCLRAAGWCCRRPPAPGTFAPNLYHVGVATAPVVALTGLFIGMVLAVQTIASMKQLDLQSHLSVSINLSVVRELGPVLVAVMLAGRVGSAIAAELATMRVTEQIDALSCLGVNPIHYLVVPRVLACILLVPVLTVMADFMGIMGGAAMSIYFYGVDSHHYWEHAANSLRLWDIMMGLIKPTVFGAAIGLICCHRGMASSGGAEGVGKAATQAFVLSFITILILDFLIALIINTIDQQLLGGARIF